MSSESGFELYKLSVGMAKNTRVVLRPCERMNERVKIGQIDGEEKEHVAKQPGEEKQGEIFPRFSMSKVVFWVSFNVEYRARATNGITCAHARQMRKGIAPNS